MTNEEIAAADWPEAAEFEECIDRLVKAKEALTANAIASRDPQKIKLASGKMLESNKRLIAALDRAFKKLQDARHTLPNFGA